jgi:hypothetical protein
MDMSPGRGVPASVTRGFPPCAGIGVRSSRGTSTHPPGGGGNPPDLMSRGLMGPSGVRGALKPVQLYAGGCRPLAGSPGKSAVAVIQIFPWVIEGEIRGDHEDVSVAR